MNKIRLIKAHEKEVNNICEDIKIDQQIVKDFITIRGRQYSIQAIEKTVQHSHRCLRKSAVMAFSVEVNYQERLVIIQEVKRTYLRILHVDEVIKAIRSAALEEHELQIYAVVLLKTSNIPKDSHGKIDRHACQNAFMNKSLDAIHTWTLNPQQDLQQLQADVDALLENVQMFQQALKVS